MKYPKFPNGSGIYAIVNTVNHKMYIGSARDLRERQRRHFGKLDQGTHVNKHLQASWNQYGQGSFVFRVLIYCDKKNLVYYEQRFIDFIKSKFGEKRLYNIDMTAGSRLGHKFSQESIDKIKANNKRPMLGKKHSPEVRAIMSARAKERASNPEWKEKMREISIGRVDSLETANKRRQSALGRKNSEEAKEKVRQAKLGKPRPEHVKQKLREANLGKKQSPETVAKRIASIKETWVRKREAGQTRI